MQPATAAERDGVETRPYRTLTIVIPVYNERETVRTVIERVMAQPTPPLRKEVVVVDDGSTDGTREILEALDWAGMGGACCAHSGDSARLVRHPRNRGKGACLRSALAEAQGELVLIQDADLEYDPADYPALLEPILNGRADAVFGNRFHCGPHRVARFPRFLLNRIFSLLCNLLTSLAISDVTAGYKALRRDLLDSLAMQSDGFSMETELTVKLARSRARIYEVPIVYYGRTYAEGKKIRWRDGLAAVYHLFRYRFF